MHCRHIIDKCRRPPPTKRRRQEHHWRRRKLYKHRRKVSSPRTAPPPRAVTNAAPLPRVASPTLRGALMPPPTANAHSRHSPRMRPIRASSPPQTILDYRYYLCAPHSCRAQPRCASRWKARLGDLLLARVESHRVEELNGIDNG